MPMLTANYRTVLDLLVGLRTGKEPNCNGDAGRHALEIAVAIRESHRRGGQRVDLPLANRWYGSIRARPCAATIR